MMVKLTTEQSIKFWPLIKSAIEDSIPSIAGDEPKFSNILKSIILGEMQVWILASSDAVKAVTVTSFTYDTGTGAKNLLIYALRAFGEMTRRDWAEGFVTLKRFAKSSGCSHITGYTENDGLIRLAERLGGEGRYVFITIPIENGDRDGR